MSIVQNNFLQNHPLDLCLTVAQSCMLIPVPVVAGVSPYGRVLQFRFAGPPTFGDLELLLQSMYLPKSSLGVMWSVGFTTFPTKFSDRLYVVPVERLPSPLLSLHFSSILLLVVLPTMLFIRCNGDTIYVSKYILIIIWPSNTAKMLLLYGFGIV